MNTLFLFFRCGMIRWFCIYCLFSLPFVAMGANSDDTLSAPYVGNWVNTSSNVWEFGFYERFAIFDTDFWDYKKIEHGKGKVTITLTKDGKDIVVCLRNTPGETIEIVQGKGKPIVYRMARKGFTPYPDKDTTFFPTYRYRTDSVTILGYYRNFERLPEKWRSKSIELGSKDYLTDGFNIYADIDSCGRFQAKVPVTGLVRIYMNWTFLGKSAYVVPGERLLVYADAADLLKRKHMDSRKDYWTYDSDVLFMGENARFHDEMSHCPSPLDIRGYYDFAEKELSDMEVLRAIEGDYLEYLNILDRYIDRFPTLSRKCVSIKKESGLYEFAFGVMQNRYRLLKNKRSAFEPGYMEFVKSKFSLDCEWYYLAEPYFQSFVRDYMDYHESLRDLFLPNGTRFSLSPVQTQDVLAHIKSNRLANAEEMVLIDAYSDYIQKARKIGTDTVAGRKLIEQNQNVLDGMTSYLASETVKDVEWLLMLRYLKTMHDTLLPNAYLSDLELGKYSIEKLEKIRNPFSDRKMAYLKEHIQTPAILERVAEVNEVYRKLARKEIAWPGSLKSAEHLKEYKDAKALFQKLIEPYKGSVVYLDVWGTWCQPCREQLPYVKEVKEALKGKKVVYLYLANRSDENVWKNLIREYDLSGENVVHYRLPEKQQSMLERLLQVDYFPTFILLDKEGNIANPKAPSPRDKKRLVEEIEKLLEQ